MSAHVHSHTGNAEAPVNVDPTGTKTLRDQFVRAFNRRFGRLRGLIRATIGYENDALELTENAEPQEVFSFPTDEGKRDQFRRWLNEAIDDEILDPLLRPSVQRGEHYTSKFITQAYRKAIRDANSELRKAGVSFDEAEIQAIVNLPVHNRVLQTLYSRSYGNLSGITDDMADSIRRELLEGVREGVNPRTLATRLNNKIETFNLTRARVLARTEVINAYNEAHLTRYEQMGVEGVTIEAEWLTAGDNRVCPICQALSGRVWTIQEARTQSVELTPGDVNQYIPDTWSASRFTGEFPVKPPSHPRCRCRLNPVVS